MNWDVSVVDAAERINAIALDETLSTQDKNEHYDAFLTHILPHPFLKDDIEKFTKFHDEVIHDPEISYGVAHWELLDGLDRLRHVRSVFQHYSTYFSKNFIDVENMVDWTHAQSFSFSLQGRVFSVNTAGNAAQPTSESLIESAIMAGVVSRLMETRKGTGRGVVLSPALEPFASILSHVTSEKAVEEVLGRFALRYLTDLHQTLPTIFSDGTNVSDVISLTWERAAYDLNYLDSFLEWMEGVSEQRLDEAPLRDVLRSFDRASSAVERLDDTDEKLNQRKRLETQKMRLALWGQRKAEKDDFCVSGMIEQTVAGVISDPEIAEDRRRFDQLSDNGKLELMRKYAHKISKMFGVFPPGIHEFRAHPQRGETGKYRIQAGYFDRSGVHLNRSPYAAWDDFDVLLAVTAHEVLHDWQATLAEKTRRGEKKCHEPDYRQGLVYQFFFEENFKAHAQSDWEFYRENPLEKAAWLFQDRLYQELKRDKTACVQTFFKQKLAAYEGDVARQGDAPIKRLDRVKRPRPSGLRP